MRTISRFVVLTIAVVVMFVGCIAVPAWWDPHYVPVTLTAERDAQAAVVSLGVPFAPGALRRASAIAVVDEAGREVPSFARSLATWPADGSQRAVLVALRVSMKAGETRELRIRYGALRLRAAGALAPNPDGPVVATLPPDWYAASLVLGPQLPAARNVAYAEWDTAIETFLATMTPPWESYGVSCASTATARTYYDGVHTLFQRFVRRASPGAYRRARVEAAWYRANELAWQDGGRVAVHACEPTWDPTVPIGTPQNDWRPMRRLTAQGMLDDYLLTGDPEALAAVRGIGETFRQNLVALTTVPPVAVKATERNMGFALLALASYFAVDPTPELAAKLDALIATTAAWQAEGVSGAFEHDLHVADPAECDVGPRGGSPFMTALLVDALMDVWSLRRHPAIPGIVTRAATWFRDEARTHDGTAFRYLWGCDERPYDDDAFIDLNTLIVHVFGAAYVHTADVRWLDVGDEMAGHALANLWAGRPKHWSQSTRTFGDFLAYRAEGRAP